MADVLHQLKSGKEATVFLCRAQQHTGMDLVAVKVYRSLSERSFRNDAVYQQGRYIKDARSRRAYRNHTNTGKMVQFSNWVSAEYQTMKILHDAGADVPEPYAQTSQAIIMEYFGTEDEPAPTLNRVYLNKPDAAVLFRGVDRPIDIAEGEL